MELIQDAQNKQQMRKVLQLVAPLSVVWPAETDCRRALSDFTAYYLSHSVGLIDALIAACTVGRQATLCTFNMKHYCAALLSHSRLAKIHTHLAFQK
ncbi:MAG: hypothetical protein VKL39_14000 [Leptolyngbyaceae bacterium]|nr:hypothetical protein [Leptolyngbyaceae bacterium]